jgi:hypothetical protein
MGNMLMASRGRRQAARLNPAQPVIQIHLGNGCNRLSSRSTVLIVLDFRRMTNIQGKVVIITAPSSLR